MTDFLLELRSEEIPARMQSKAREDLARLFAAELDKAGLKAGELVTHATPRRLALIARDLPNETAAASEEIKGPRANAPEQALEGFLRKTGLTRDQLVERDGVLFAVIDKPGRATVDVLAEAIPAIIRAFPWPKSMRWGEASLSTESLRWVRPLQGIVTLFGGEVVPCEVAGITSGRATIGHRFMSSGVIAIESPATYAEQLRAAHVIVDQDERAALIRTRAAELAAEAGLALIEDEGLVAENAGLTEWPVPLLGRFDDAFLSVPPEVIQLTARVNQKYFVCSDSAGKLAGPHQSNTLMGSLANAFICVANIAAADGGAKIVEGNRKVLAARLSDARFFFETDLKVPLEAQAKKLDRIVFHEKLGTVADKVERVAKLARWLVESDIVIPAQAGIAGDHAEHRLQTTPAFAGVTKEELAALAERAARLCKADLVTGMVGEFPELQGVMGGYCALAQGEDQRVAAAIRDHYKPVGAGDDVPTEPVTVAVSLADKLDTLVGFFLIDERPTGSKDPFALRRAMLGLIRTVVENRMRVGLTSPFQTAMVLQIQNIAWQQVIPFEEDFWAIQSRRFAETLRPSLANAALEAKDEKQRDLIERGIDNARLLNQFLADRLKVQQREAGVRHDLIDAVFALGGEDDLVRLLARVRALQSFITTEDGANLLAGYKRAANILKKEGAAPLPGREGLGVGRPTRGAAQLLPTPDPSLPGRGVEALSYTPEIAEADLIAALDAAAPAAADAIAREDFEGAMAALATLRAPIDAFFDTVTVNDSDPAKRAARLALLARVRDAVHAVADFSKIEG
ncbi:glycine--tRNA ligase subunit beta [Sphingomonas sp. GlSt437]|uniref:glycine--tRNA ligase subunit beta n=1 Tax=Sphingomonas sp. GlSt437 TaxID=3389970 RepID=UPI003A895EA8